MPAVIFVDPEIATVGISEMDAKKANREVRVGNFPFTALGRALTAGAKEGFVKLIADPKTDELLGAGIVGYGASDLIAECAYAIESGATVNDIALTVHAHPTFAESLMEAAEAVHGHAVHILQAAAPKPAAAKA
jgi:dihydrolipoamide dehydrogenase